jgi:hypothetical protein
VDNKSLEGTMILEGRAMTKQRKKEKRLTGLAPVRLIPLLGIFISHVFCALSP